MTYTQRVLALAMGAGEILLGCGAEIARVEETMHRIVAHYRVGELEAYVVANGIFGCVVDGRGGAVQRIRNVRGISANLTRISLVNALSRQIEQGLYTVEEAQRRLDEIAARKTTPRRWLLLAAAVGSASCCWLFGGDAWDALGSFVSGLAAYLLVVAVQDRRFSKVLLYSACGLLVTLLSVLLERYGWVNHLDVVIMGAIMPMIPGVSFLNGVREIADANYLSGSIRLLDALLVFVCLAAGVGFGLFATGAAGGTLSQEVLLRCLLK